MKRIVLTGGGTAGHVTPNIALISQLKKEGFDIYYIGSYNGMEKELIEKTGVPYYGISTGKFRRGKDLKSCSKNITDIFRVFNGITQANTIIKKINPDVVFSKGGFVSVPVVLAAKSRKIPVIIHESDISPGLANKISMKYAKVVCTTFPETVNYIGEKAVCTGTPIRKEVFEGDKTKGLEICGFNNSKPVIMVMGGSLGAVKINNCIRQSLDKLLVNFQVAHLCGKGNIDISINKKGYKQFEYVSDDLPHIFSMADIIIARAGSNSISEFLALKKPSLLIPLSKKASRGDQILNAKSFLNQGFSKMLEEENLDTNTLILEVNDLYKNRQKYIGAMESNAVNNGIENVMALIRKYSGNYDK